MRGDKIATKGALGKMRRGNGMMMSTWRLVLGGCDDDVRWRLPLEAGMPLGNCRDEKRRSKTASEIFGRKF